MTDHNLAPSMLHILAHIGAAMLTTQLCGFVPARGSTQFVMKDPIGPNMRHKIAVETGNLPTIEQ